VKDNPPNADSAATLGLILDGGRAQRMAEATKA
jgi:hypothetical protein